MSESPRPYTLTDTWHLNNRVNLKLLDALTEEQLAVKPNPRARNIAEQITHLHAVRISWLEAMEPNVTKDLAKIEKGASKTEIKRGLEKSAEALGQVFAAAEQKGTLKAFKRGPVAFLGYILAHEASHRGQILLHLKYAGKPADRTLGYDLWEWDKI